jgi:acyl carrier protein
MAASMHFQSIPSGEKTMDAKAGSLSDAQLEDISAGATGHEDSPFQWARDITGMEHINAATRIGELNLDSLQGVEMIQAFEDKYGVTIPAEEVENILKPERTLGDIIAKLSPAS